MPKPLLERCKTILLTIFLLLILCVLSYAKGFIAFDYDNPNRSDIDFLSGFKVIVTGSVWKRSVIKRLKRKSVKLVFYDWLPADYFCKDDVNGWHKAVLKHLNHWVIDSSFQDPDPMGKRYGCKDYFFSFTDNFIEARVKHVLKVLKKNGYNGVFFDWASGFKAFQNDKDFAFLVMEFKNKFKGINYDHQVLKFLKALKKKGVLIILNRGFRSKNAMFDRYADFDVAESVFTTDESKICRYVFIEDYGLKRVCETSFEKPKIAVRYGGSFIKEAKKSNPKIGFVFLNYALPFYIKTEKTVIFNGKTYNIYNPVIDRQAIFYAYAISLILREENFTVSSDVGLNLIKDTIYFSNIGNPLDKYKIVRSKKDEAFIRYFTNGIVVVGNDGVTVNIKTYAKSLYNCYTKTEVKPKGGLLKITLKSKSYFNHTKQPVGLILLVKNNEIKH